MADVSSIRRLTKEYENLLENPVPYVIAKPLPTNIWEWHYVISGPENTPYEGGKYHGKLLFPREYPFKPPTFYMITPNGRFRPNTKLCLSISNYHPETWNPAWTVAAILTGLLSIMTENSFLDGMVIFITDNQRRHLSAQSLAFNLRDRQFCELFPDVVETIEAELLKRKEEEDKKREEEEKKKEEGGHNGGGWLTGWFS